MKHHIKSYEHSQIDILKMILYNLMILENDLRISKYKIIFTKGYIPNWSKVFVTKKVKNTTSRTYVISDLKDEEVVGTFYEKELQKTKQEFTIEKVIKRKGDKLHVKWKGYANLFNIWIDKKDIV